jgi:3-keto-disaccharide hydrolase
VDLYNAVSVTYAVPVTARFAPPQMSRKPLGGHEPIDAKDGSELIIRLPRHQGGYMLTSSRSLTIAFVCVLAGGLGISARQTPTRPPPTQESGRTLPPRTPADDGFTDTPILPGLPWHVHDRARPHPPVVTPGATVGAAPSDARVLFDGRDLSRWAHHDTADGKLLDAKWVVADGYFETGAGAGSLYTRESFGDIQLHVEWATPAVIAGNSQGRGNSGIFLMRLYEIQVLDSYNNSTYADGQAGAIYGQWPPLANVARKSGEWQTYDIVFEAPRFENGKLVKPAFQTVFWNGVIIHNRKEVMGPTVYRDIARYAAPHPAELPLMLQDHGNPVRYRNIWVRRLGRYDDAER